MKSFLFTIFLMRFVNYSFNSSFIFIYILFKGLIYSARENDLANFYFGSSSSSSYSCNDYLVKIKT
jgi:hypothetical protein